MFGKVEKFFMEVAAELKKVSWPTRHELWESSLIVLLSSALLGVFIASADYLLANIIKVVIK